LIGSSPGNGKLLLTVVTNTEPAQHTMEMGDRQAMRSQTYLRTLQSSGAGQIK
jgi:hypothetical protein